MDRELAHQHVGEAVARDCPAVVKRLVFVLQRSDKRRVHRIGLRHPTDVERDRSILRVRARIGTDLHVHLGIERNRRERIAALRFVPMAPAQQVPSLMRNDECELFAEG